MAILDIRTYPDSVLLQQAVEVEQVDDSIRRLLDDMAETMYSAPGVGLAAPQVGVSVRAIVVDASPKDEHASLLKLINPIIISAEGGSTCEEGCLSVPGFTADVQRANKVVVKALDEHGKPVKIETDTFLATVLQHEIEHLEGTLFIDHLGRLKRDMIRRKLKKKARKQSKKSKQVPV